MPAFPTKLDPPLGDNDIGALQDALDALPEPLAPLDVSALDGYLCGVLLQPEPVPAARWLRFVVDEDGRALPAGAEASRIDALAQRRHAELSAAITQRNWFDPWVFELDGADADAALDAVSQAALPWVAGFALAMEHFPVLMQRLDDTGAVAPLALIYRHLPADDLEDADALLEEIESLEPCADLAEAVEGLVRATLLLADLAHGGAQPALRSRAGRRRRPSAARVPPRPCVRRAGR